MLIVIANAPRIYRQVLAAEVRARRPHDEVIVTEPHQLPDALQRLAPDAVITTEEPAAIGPTTGWLLLYPDRQNAARLRLAGAAFDLAAPDLQLVLAFLTLASRRP